jgi:hypothetical protein
MSIATEIEARIVTLSDPKVKWVRGIPRPGEACMMSDGSVSVSRSVSVSPWSFSLAFSTLAHKWLNEWFSFATMADRRDRSDRRLFATEWNDLMAHSKAQVIDMLADAWADAIEEGV